MAGRLSRRKIAAYYADRLLAGKKSAPKELAAYLVDSGRIRELDLIVRDIEAALADRGVLVADVTSSRKLTDATAKEVKAYLKSATKATTIELREAIDPDLLGGVRIGIPGKEMDASLRHRLNQLKASKI
jgi:F-type H+-transporting ATPase subunit delta